MKTLITLLTLIISLSSFASADYTCYVNGLKLELKSDHMNSTLLIRDAQTREIISNVIIHDIVAAGDTTDLMFDMGNSKFLQLRFKTAAYEASEGAIFGLARGDSGRQILDHSMRCLKKE